jgi:hypothetical protein
MADEKRLLIKYDVDASKYTDGMKKIALGTATAKNEMKLWAAEHSRSSTSSMGFLKQQAATFKQTYSNIGAEIKLTTDKIKLFEAANNQPGADKMKNRLLELKTEYANVGNAMDRIDTPIKRFGASMTALQPKIASVAKVINTAIIGGIAALGAGLTKITTNAVNSAEELTMMSDRTGMSLKSLQEWRYVLKDLDVDFSVVQSSMSMFVNKMKGLDQEGGDFTKTVSMLGIAMKDSAGQTRTTSDIYNDAIKALSYMQNPTDMATAASALFGRGWMELMPILSAGAKRLDELRAAYKALNIEKSDEQIRALENLGDQVEVLKMEFDSAFMDIASDFLPTLRDKLIPFIQTSLIPVLKDLGGKLKDLTTWWAGLTDEEKRFKVITAGIILAIPTLVSGFATLVTAINGAKIAFANMGITGASAFAGIARAAGIAGIAVDRSVEKYDMGT